VWEKTKLPDWEEVPYVDPGTRATPDKRNLFVPGSKHREITPAIGEEIWVSEVAECNSVTGDTSGGGRASRDLRAEWCACRAFNCPS
jgi:hypothetical protein